MEKIQTAVFMLGLGLVLAAGNPAQEPWQVIRIEADEYRFIPNHIKLLAAKPVKIEIHNSGNEGHEFRSRLLEGHLIEVEGKEMTVKGTGIHSIMIEKGTTIGIKWLSPTRGTYEFECRIPSHHGMDGTIFVDVGK